MEKEVKDTITNIKQAIRHLATLGVPTKQLIDATKAVEEKLAESEDDKIRKDIIHHIEFGKSHNIIPCKRAESWLAYLEKQGKQKPNFCHHEVDLSNCSEEYRKAYYDGWNNCNMQHSKCKSELDDVIKCLINGMKFYYKDNKEAIWGTGKWSMPVKHIIKVLEKQGEQKPAEWSDEDEQFLLVCKNALYKYQVSDKWDAGIISRWLENRLKSHYSQRQWKPNGDQLDALYDMIHSFKKESSYSNRDYIANIVDTLFEQLKAL